VVVARGVLPVLQTNPENFNEGLDHNGCGNPPAGLKNAA
jgi:hypothetical protein